MTALRRISCWGVGLLPILAGGAHPALAQVAGGMQLPTVERRMEVSNVAPPWLALPSNARVLTSAGMEMRPLRNSGVSYENIKLGLLVGALKNHGHCARDLTVRLQYTDDRWQPIGEPIDSEARVSEVEPAGLVPYRFRLRRTDEMPAAPSGYIIQVSEQGKPVSGPIEWVSTRKVDPVACPPATLRLRAVSHKSRPTLRGYRITGTLTVDAGGPVRPDGVTLTAVLLDKEGQVLEVLTGIPDVDEKTVPSGTLLPGQTVPFTLSSPIPVGKAVSSVLLFPEALPDARVEGRRRTR
jgi:hypothetical protein